MINDEGCRYFAVMSQPVFGQRGLPFQNEAVALPLLSDRLEQGHIRLFVCLFFQQINQWTVSKKNWE